MNNTAGLFGGLLIGVALLAAYAWQKGTLQAALGTLTDSSTTDTTTGTNGNGVPDLSNSSIGTYTSLVGSSSIGTSETIPTSTPYQLAVSPINGVTIQTAAATPSFTIPAPSTPAAAPTTPTLVYA